MTVYELIQVLAQYPPDAEVAFEVTTADGQADLAFREAVRSCMPRPVVIRLKEE